MASNNKRLKDSKTSVVIWRAIFALLCIALLILRIVFPGVKIDQTSIWLVILIVAIVLLPDPKDIFSRMRRFKKGDFEIDFDARIHDLKRAVKETEDETSPDQLQLSAEGIPSDVMDRIEHSMSEPRGALINIGVEIEKRLAELADQNEIKTPGRFFSPRRALEKLVGMQKLPPQALSLFLDYWAIRNDAAHMVGFDLDRDYLYELANLGLKILGYLYAIK